jgi:hypothetical protein
VSWLRAAGLVDVREETVPIPQRKSCSSEDIARISTEGYVHSVKLLCGIGKGRGLDLLVMEGLLERMREELETSGGELRFIAAIGRMP